MDRQAGFGLLGWDRLMVGLDRLIGGFGSFGLIIGSSGDDFWVFSTAWVSNWRRGFVDRWLY